MEPSLCSFLPLLTITLLLGGTQVLTCCYGSPDYARALHGSLLFFEGQRSGHLPSNQRVTWRSDSALSDGFEQGVNLVGGYYDAGDNVKFGLPMAFTITMLSWSVIEYGGYIGSAGQLGYALEAIKWGTDYLIKAHPEPNVLWGEVGDGDSDHYCWQRPEEMTTSRKAYKISPNDPGSDLAGETAAAMAAASVVFRRRNLAYSQLLLRHAKELFSFADTYKGRYDSSITVARKYYQSESGYNDELLWSALWLFEATSDNYYLNYAIENAHALGGTGWSMTEFSWDVKYAGLQVLASKILFEGRGTNLQVLQQYQKQAEFFLCACLQKNNRKNVARTPGGLIYTRSWNNMQYVTSASFLLTVYSDYLSKGNRLMQCPAGNVKAAELFKFAKSQVDYILGVNPRGTSYMIGFGSNYPQRVHHRAASIISYKKDPTFVACRVGYRTWYTSQAGDPNVHVGAIVGGPDENDNYADDRHNFDQSEPTTYNNGPIVGVLARLHASESMYMGSFTASPASVQKPVDLMLSISQIMTGSWRSQGHNLYRYQVTVTNNAPNTLRSIQLSVQGLNGPVWGLSKTGPSSYTLPRWLEALAPYQSMTFVYVHSGPEAAISVANASFP
ncbi:hypothetical protein KP509_18G079600 [Ceratopteris richardii]|uniref:Endoglucanase n=1 Tax=Ceratopteris richardii TaxID=49495 RepID=A0A8T2SUZ8_CERRI|nr:hypothetical protein KP509_18G079600 [Ceratopteris richardii]KAH7366468.1 hypothetical protein KP509_18G079600 [Ceratopteris richardii]KAH7366469.1 hypothetical protein KP509_18G079600 [Ceratopteris richardii]KAH7366470.1 hypothetical protein KP509_18G079600 [Ceratopteris richardii]